MRLRAVLYSHSCVIPKAASALIMAADHGSSAVVQALLRQREAELGQAKQQCVEEKRRLWAESDIRRRLHNELQELKVTFRHH